MDTIIQDVVLETSPKKSIHFSSQHDAHNHNPSMLVYLQHLDCDLCRHTIEELRHIAPTDPNFPSVIFFHPGSMGDGNSIRQVWPDVVVIADPAGHIYRRLPWSEEAFGQCLALTSRPDTAQNYAHTLENFWLMPEVI